MDEILQVPNQVGIRAMRRNWWIAYKWICVQEHGQMEPVYVMAGMRPIEESLEAASQFDEAIKNYRACIYPGKSEDMIKSE